MNKTERKISLGFGLIIILMIVNFWYEHRKTESLAIELKNIKSSMASTTAELQDNIAKTHTEFNNAISQQNQSVGTLQQQLGNFQQQVGSVSSTVNTLQKLSKTDPQLLQKYSKVFFLSENYIPAHLSEIPSLYKYSDVKALTIVTNVLPRLEYMISDAARDGVLMYVSSAYRSFNEQKNLKSDYRITYGAGTANSFSADQGYSEHQLGTAVDMIAPGQGGVLDGFDKTKAYGWLMANAYKYGFIISYPKDNTFYVYEPWHWRFVGVKLSTDLHNQGKHFYDLDQRDIDAYLVSLFD